MRRLALVALIGCGRIGFDPTGVGDGGGGGGGSVTISDVCPTVVYADTFAGVPGFWFPDFAGSCGGSVTSQGTDLLVSYNVAPSAGCELGLRQKTAMDVHGICAVLEIAGVPSNPADRTFVAVGSSTDRVGVEINTQLRIVSRTASIDTEGNAMPYDAAAQRFVLIHQTGTTFELGTSANAATGFRVIGSVPVGSVPLAATGVMLGECSVGSGANGDASTFATVAIAH